MAYERLHWVESETPLSAENMNNIEDGIEELQSQKVDKVSGKGLSDQNYTAAEKTKLAGIEAGAEVNVQADWNQSDSSADDFIKNKPGNATTSAAGLMSAADKTKLNGIATGAEVNQNAFSEILVNGSIISADAKTDHFQVIGSNGIEVSSVADSLLINGKYATASASGVMSAADKAKLNGISSKAVHLDWETLHPTEQYTIYDGAIEEIITSDCSSSNIIGLAEVEFLNSSGNRIPLAICGYRRSGSHLLITVFNPRNSAAAVAKSSRIKVYYWE